MKLQILSIGKPASGWVQAAFDDYHRRLPAAWQVTLTQIPRSQFKNSNSTSTLMQEEGKKLLSLIPAGGKTICLDSAGQSFSSEAFAQKLERWWQDQATVSFLIGGPDGLSSQCKEQADLVLSLSALTYPHQLVKVILIEQLYRSWSILNRQPYHLCHSE